MFARLFARRVCLLERVCWFAWAIVWTLASGASGQAQSAAPIADVQTAAAEPAGLEEEEEEQEQETPRPKLFALGDFHVRDYRPTRNETIDVRFSLFLALSPDSSDAVLQRLEHWKQRLRDQAIIAIRLVQTKDFVEPELLRLQRVIRFRVNRILHGGVVKAVYVNDFALGDD